MEYRGVVHTPEKNISRGVWYSKVEAENGSLWVLLHWHALQEKCFANEKVSSLFLERITLRIGDDGWPNKKYQFICAIVELEKSS